MAKSFYHDLVESSNKFKEAYAVNKAQRDGVNEWTELLPSVIVID